MRVISAEVIKCFTVTCLTGGAIEMVELGYCKENTAQPNNCSCSVPGFFGFFFLHITSYLGTRHMELRPFKYRLLWTKGLIFVTIHRSTISQESVVWILRQCSSWICTVMTVFPFKSSPQNRANPPFSSLFWRVYCKGPNEHHLHCKLEETH